MKHGFICTAAATPKIRVADPVYNGEQVLLLMRQGAEQKAKVMVFPELCLTGYTCDDLFFQNTLLKKAGLIPEYRPPRLIKCIQCSIFFL